MSTVANRLCSTLSAERIRRARAAHCPRGAVAAPVPSPPAPCAVHHGLYPPRRRRPDRGHGAHRLLLFLRPPRRRPPARRRRPLRAAGRHAAGSPPPRHPPPPPPTAVFTGIVEEVGKVVSLTNEDIATSGGGCTLVVRATVAADGVALGDSVAVNGVCLTATATTPVGGDGGGGGGAVGAVDVAFGLAAETLRCTALGDLAVGDGVNLERSLSAAGRFGGHVVQGHVDAAGTLTSVTPDADALVFVVALERRLMKYVVRKGYVAIDGTSLTVVDVTDAGFSFMMIPYTQAHVALAAKRAGDRVNVEVDITGKYIEKIVAERLAEADAATA
ncbi:hypothetical protein BU14_0763s0005 [Porphyra umbilicalis]|uniref:Riboflavin synthase n=1 Tax=Porphyra umbilicalis TaxID=2786 RepID=A0A1X6NPG7_PORUM|nr:hypothetical protein BU14_0763s0005 [Porphyra umbilicalis]|eukprot:OSX70420.1 hypothetical protein BU14_0763s0005 [Porphyra umbilicalis]